MRKAILNLYLKYPSTNKSKKFFFSYSIIFFVGKVLDFIFLNNSMIIRKFATKEFANCPIISTKNPSLY
jgi:hypothetical protein